MWRYIWESVVNVAGIYMEEGVRCEDRLERFEKDVARSWGECIGWDVAVGRGEWV